MPFHTPGERSKAKLRKPKKKKKKKANNPKGKK